MSDTTPAVAAEYRRRLMALTPGQRVAMACDMFDTAKALARAGILKNGPLPEAELRVRLFLRFYGNDFSTAECARIVEHLRTV